MIDSIQTVLNTCCDVGNAVVTINVPQEPSSINLANKADGKQVLGSVSTSASSLALNPGRLSPYPRIYPIINPQGDAAGDAAAIVMVSDANTTGDEHSLQMVDTNLDAERMWQDANELMQMSLPSTDVSLDHDAMWQEIMAKVFSYMLRISCCLWKIQLLFGNLRVKISLINPYRNVSPSLSVFLFISPLGQLGCGKKFLPFGFGHLVIDREDPLVAFFWFYSSDTHGEAPLVALSSYTIVLTMITKLVWKSELFQGWFTVPISHVGVYGSQVVDTSNAVLNEPYAI